MKRALIIISLVIFSANIFAQSWPSSSATRPSFSGFGVVTEEENSSVFENGEATSETFAGDYITTPETKSFGDNENPGNPGEVPIIESILGLFGLGGVYAWRLFSKKRKGEE